MSVTIIADIRSSIGTTPQSGQQLIDAAKAAGANAVLASCFLPQNIAVPQSMQSKALQNFALDYGQISHLMDDCKKVGIAFLAAPHDIDSISFLHQKGMPIWFLTPDNIDNVPLLVRMAESGRPVFVDCGCHDTGKLRQCVQILKQFGTTNVVLLQSSLCSPTPLEQINLRGMVALKGNLQCDIGFVDTTQSCVMCSAAAAFGAVVLVKALDPKQEGSGVTPEEFAKMVQDVHHVQLGLGSGDRTPTTIQAQQNAKNQKRIVAACPIEAGSKFSELNMAIKYAPQGQDQLYWYDLCEQTASHDYGENEPIFLQNTNEGD